VGMSEEQMETDGSLQTEASSPHKSFEIVKVRLSCSDVSDLLQYVPLTKDMLTMQSSVCGDDAVIWYSMYIWYTTFFFLYKKGS